MNTLLDAIADKKDRLDRLRPLPPEALRNLEHYYDVEITYTSNAIEGNTLSPVETTLVIEQGVTIGGKPLKDHLEALDHYDAIRYVRELAREKTPLTDSDVRNLHRLVVRRSRPDIAGRYADLARYVRTETGRHAFPSPADVPALMGDFAKSHGAAFDEPHSHSKWVSARGRASGGPVGLCSCLAGITGGARRRGLRQVALRAVGRDLGGLLERSRAGATGIGGSPRCQVRRLWARVEIPSKRAES